jgi:hypothetical protein
MRARAAPGADGHQHLLACSAGGINTCLLPVPLKGIDLLVDKTLRKWILENSPTQPRRGQETLGME